MNKSIIILILGLATAQIVLCAPGTTAEGTNAEDSLKESQRYKLVEYAYRNLEKTVWPQEVLDKMTEYLNEMKDWFETDETLKKYTIHEELQNYIEKCSELLEDLKETPDNCQKQWALKEEHDKIRNLIDSVEIVKLRRDWTRIYRKFSIQMRSITTYAYRNFYTELSAEIEDFLNGSNASEAEDILEWNKKFSQESDYVKKQQMVMEFMALFPNERSILDVNCKVQYSNGF